jgi:phosphatidylinositol glycan class A protein
MDLLSFKKGAFYLAVQCKLTRVHLRSQTADSVAGAPVIPVVCENYHHLYDGKTHFKSGTLKIKGQLA